MKTTLMLMMMTKLMMLMIMTLMIMIRMEVPSPTCKIASGKSEDCQGLLGKPHEGGLVAPTLVYPGLLAAVRLVQMAGGAEGEGGGRFKR